jgi:hypothetical protein
MDRRKTTGQFANSGVSYSDLERGYSDTGYIPEVGDRMSQLDAMAAQEAKEEKQERDWQKACGCIVESDVGGFLERNNTDDRM